MTLLKRLYISITIVLLCSAAAVAQPVEPEFDDAAYRSIPEVQCYAALCRAVYWQHMARQTIDETESRGKYREAREQLEAAILYDPRSSFLYTKLAEVYISLGDGKGAVSACMEALKLNPDNADANFLLGKLRVRRDRKGAISAFKRAAELNPEHLGAQYYLGALLYDTEDFAGAARAYAMVVKADPYNHKLRNRLGISYAEIGETAKAIEEFNAAARLRSDYLEPHFWLARLYARQSRNEEAIEECLIVLAQEPGDEGTILLLSELYIAMDEFDRAIPRLKKLVEQRRIDRNVLAEAYYRLATAYRDKKETSLAESHFEKSIEIYKGILEKDQENVDIRYYMAMVYDARGDTSRAEQYLREYIELKPDEANAYNYLGYMLVQNGVKLEEALGFIKKAVADEPENGAFRDSLGWAYFKLGNLDGAIAELERAVELIPDDSEVREHLGEVYLKKGGEFAPKAVAQWEKALEIKPNNTTLQQRLEELSKSLE